MRASNPMAPHEATAVVIGAGGMGMAVARRMAQHYPVILADLDGARAEDAACRLNDEGGRVVGIQCDVTSTSDVHRLGDEVARRGTLRALVHVAGLSPSMADFDTIMRVNLVGVANVSAVMLPLAGPRTASVLIASLAGHNFQPADDLIAILRRPDSPELINSLRSRLAAGEDTPERAYQLSKWAVVDFARLHAHPWGQRGARIVSLSPGLIATPQGSLENQARPSKRKMMEQSPLLREGSMVEIADAVEFLVSGRASFISGTDLLVDGGLAAVLRDPRPTA